MTQDNKGFGGTHIECEICGEMVERGIVSYSNHWVEKHGSKMDFVNKVDQSCLSVNDKMELIKKEFGIHQ